MTGEEDGWIKASLKFWGAFFCFPIVHAKNRVIGVSELGEIEKLDALRVEQENKMSAWNNKNREMRANLLAQIDEDSGIFQKIFADKRSPDRSHKLAALELSLDTNSKTLNAIDNTWAVYQRELADINSAIADATSRKAILSSTQTYDALASNSSSITLKQLDVATAAQEQVHKMQMENSEATSAALLRAMSATPALAGTTTTLGTTPASSENEERWAAKAKMLPIPSYSSSSFSPNSSSTVVINNPTYSSSSTSSSRIPVPVGNVSLPARKKFLD